jgi:hypothetical protein
MRPSQQFQLISVRMLQAIRRQCGLDQSMVRLIDRGEVLFFDSAERTADYRAELSRSQSEHEILAARMEEELPEAALRELLAAVPPGSRDAEAIEAELAFRAARERSISAAGR